MASSSVCFQSPVMEQQLFTLQRDPYQYEPSKPNPNHCRLLNTPTRDRLFSKIDSLYAPTIQSSHQTNAKRIISFQRSNSPIRRTPQFNSALLKMKQKGANSTLQRLRSERDNECKKEAPDQQMSPQRAQRPQQQSDQQVKTTESSSSNNNPLGRQQSGRRMSLNARTA